jgi:hypothetical protein
MADCYSVGSVGYELKGLNMNEKMINERGNTAGNIINGGYVAQQGEWIYYSDIDISPSHAYVHDDDQNAKLYKMRPDNSDRTKISDDKCQYINVIGDWIFYCNLSDNNKLYKIRANGRDRTKISDDGCGYINVIGDWIFYCNVSNEYIIYKIKTDGSSRTWLDGKECASYINVFGGWVYYYSHANGNICRIRTDGREKIEIINLSDEDCECDEGIFVIENRIFYIEQYHYSASDYGCHFRLCELHIDEAGHQIL